MADRYNSACLVRSSLLVLAALACHPAPASGQTTDPLFRSWRWTEEVTAPRALGLGGAVVGLADDGTAAVFNPASLAVVPRAGELQLSLRLPGHGTLHGGDRLDTQAKAGSPASFVLRLGSRVGIGYHFVTLRSSTRTTLDDGREAGFLKTSVNGPGVGLGVRLSPYVNLGLSLSAVRFYVNEGEYTRTAETGPDLRVRLNSNGDTRVTGTLGMLVKAREVSYGLAVRVGRRWGGRRDASNPATGRVVDDGTVFGVVTPTVISGGIAWQPDVRRAGTFLLTGQVDRVLLGRIQPTSVPGLVFPGRDYRVADAWEVHAGGEVTIPFLTTWAARGGPWRPNRVQFRAGWHRQGAGSIAYEGTDPVERGLFPEGSYRRLWSMGASIGGTTILRLSGAVRFGGDTRLAVIGVTIRYPGLFP